MVLWRSCTEVWYYVLWYGTTVWYGIIVWYYGEIVLSYGMVLRQECKWDMHLAAASLTHVSTNTP